MTLLQSLRAGAAEPIDDIRSLVLAISRIPYGRPPTRTPEGVVEAWRGTCSDKHLLLRAALPELDPGRAVELVHRIYVVDRDTAGRLWGPALAAQVPSTGLVDVHTYAVVTPPGVTVDVTVALRLVCMISSFLPGPTGGVGTVRGPSTGGARSGSHRCAAQRNPCEESFRQRAVRARPAVAPSRPRTTPSATLRTASSTAPSSARRTVSTVNVLNVV